MRAYKEGMLVKEKHGERWGDVVRVSEDGKRIEFHCKNKRCENVCLFEYEVEHYQPQGRVHA